MKIIHKEVPKEIDYIELTEGGFNKKAIKWQCGISTYLYIINGTSSKDMVLNPKELVSALKELFPELF